MQDRDDGSIQVFEAVIVAVLILTAVLFFTTLQRPSGATDSGGVDLGTLSADILVVLEQRTFKVEFPVVDPVNHTMAQWVNRVVEGNTTVAADVEEFMDGILGDGTQWAIRLENGFGSHHLLPFGTEPIPLAARAASTFTSITLDAFNTSASAATTTVPGGPIQFESGFPSVDCDSWTVVGPTEDIEDPDGPTTGSTTGGGGDSWSDIWSEDCGEIGDFHAPAEAPFGVYQVTATGCSPCYVVVGLPGETPSAATAAAARTYGLELILWTGT